MIKWAICDDADYLCKSFEWAFEADKEMKFCGSANNSSDCLDLIQKSTPDVLLLDIQMETPEAGLKIIPQLKQLCPTLKIVMLTNYDDEDNVFTAFVNGADEFINKNLPDSEILQTVHNVFNNTSSLRPEIAQKLIKKSQEIQNKNTSLIYTINMLNKLSTSEFEVLKSCYYGESYKQIAADRFVDVSTIRTLASRILKKFEYKTMNSLVHQLSALHVFEYLDGTL